MISVLLGVVLIATTLVDVFLTVLHYQHFGSLSTCAYRQVWRLSEIAARALPTAARERVLALVGPLMLVGTLVAWTALPLLGFALVYLPGLEAAAFAVPADVSATFATALYFSGTTLSTLGYGDVTPEAPLYQALAVGQAILGFGLFSMAVSYLLSVYQALHVQNLLAAGLVSDDDEGRAVPLILHERFPHGRPRQLSPLLQLRYEQVLNLGEGLRRYPIVYYFHGRRPSRSLPAAMRALGELLAALRYGLPQGHEAQEDPWLPCLERAYSDALDFLARGFLPARPEPPPPPPPLEAFVAQVTGAQPLDPPVERFLGMQETMARIAALAEAPDARDAYERYRAWFRFSWRAAAIIGTAAQRRGGAAERAALEHPFLVSPGRGGRDR